MCKVRKMYSQKYRDEQVRIKQKLIARGKKGIRHVGEEGEINKD